MIADSLEETAAMVHAARRRFKVRELLAAMI
jgi:hypothetical protein